MVDNERSSPASGARKRHRESSISSSGAEFSISSTVLHDEERNLEAEHFDSKLRMMKDQFQRERERQDKCLQFLEEENSQLRATITADTERYYEDKKRLRLRISQLEAEKKESKSTSSAVIENVPPRPSIVLSAAPAPSTNPANDEAIRELQCDLDSLEGQMLKKSEEVLRLVKENVDLEGKLRNTESLHQSLILTGTDLNLNDVADLRKRCVDLESSLRNKTRDVERLGKKQRNQILLEEEAAHLHKKLELAESANARTQALEAEKSALEAEKSAWSVLFQDIVGSSQESDDSSSPQQASSSSSSNSRGGGSGSGSSSGSGSGTVSQGVTAAMALSALSKARQQATRNLKESIDLQSRVRILEAQLARADKARLAAEKAQKEAQQCASSAQADAELRERECSLFEGEISSLRSLLKSYDTEYKFGKGNLDRKVLEGKDELLQSARTELDKSRKESQRLFAENLEKQRSTKNTTAADAREHETLQARVRTLEEEKALLQKASGLDYIPGQVRILHMQDNPFAVAAAAAMAAATAAAAAAARAAAGAPADPNSSLLAARTPQAAGRALGPTTPAMGSALKLNTSITTGGGGGSAAPDSSKLNQRLKEMFRERITCFREAVYLLTGYKIDLYSASSNEGGHTRLRLRSMYAEDPDDSLVFQVCVIHLAIYLSFNSSIHLHILLSYPSPIWLGLAWLGLVWLGLSFYSLTTTTTHL
jgi:mitotic spindle assembly checkpoint protein MAD1